ncbi:ras-related protein Rab-13-like [Mya arenaria]|uniref:ras-related protein Rab-13-like n=1 Tax=Mya arenaria TaxID=6604 RepID=UPI0022E32C39|nr:ras-related protein Rab-13-like [Mya arenaria]
MISKRYDHLLRLLLVGETGVGKTCLLCRYASDDFVSSHISTIGIDFKMKMIDVDGKTVKVQIWDTAGQERFEAITKQFYRRAQGILLVFDISSRKSYESVPRWLQLVNENCKENTVVTLIGNKSDKADTRQVPFMEAQTFADQHNINFYEVSAKNRNNVDKPFQDMCRSILQQEDQSPEQENTSITIDTNTPAASSQGSGEQDPALGPGVTGEGEGSQQGNWCCSIS